MKTPHPVLRLAEFPAEQLIDLLGRYGLELINTAPGQAIPGSFWGEEEAGLIENRLYARPDTPLHSILHETCHYLCMDNARRRGLHTDAGGDYAEENGVCYLQILLAGHLPALGRERMFQDMDAWGYSFRLGSSRAWFERDAEDALAWLKNHGLLDEAGRLSWRLRED